MWEPIAQFGPDWLIELFHEQNVEYVMVGGYAGLLHGATRPTLDLDVVPDWERANLDRLCTALRSLNARAITGPECEGEAITPDVLIEREIMTWSTDLGRLDTMVGIPDNEGLPVDYADLASRALVLPLDDIDIKVASLDDVITSKEFAGRSNDSAGDPRVLLTLETRMEHGNHTQVDDGYREAKDLWQGCMVGTGQDCDFVAPPVDYGFYILRSQMLVAVSSNAAGITAEHEQSAAGDDADCLESSGLYEVREALLPVTAAPPSP